MPNFQDNKVHKKLTPKEIRHKAKRIIRRADLPQQRALAAYLWLDVIGEASKAVVGKRDRQVLDAIINSPVFCASPIRISDSVLRLRRDHGLPIETETFTERDGDENLTFGAYFMDADVQLATSKAEAA